MRNDNEVQKLLNDLEELRDLKFSLYLKETDFNNKDFWSGFKWDFQDEPLKSDPILVSTTSKEESKIESSSLKESTPNNSYSFNETLPMSTTPTKSEIKKKRKKKGGKKKKPTVVTIESFDSINNSKSPSNFERKASNVSIRSQTPKIEKKGEIELLDLSDEILDSDENDDEVEENNEENNQQGEIENKATTIEDKSQPKEENVVSEESVPQLNEEEKEVEENNEEEVKQDIKEEKQEEEKEKQVEEDEETHDPQQEYVKTVQENVSFESIKEENDSSFENENEIEKEVENYENMLENVPEEKSSDLTEGETTNKEEPSSPSETENQNEISQEENETEYVSPSHKNSEDSLPNIEIICSNFKEESKKQKKNDSPSTENKNDYTFSMKHEEYIKDLKEAINYLQIDSNNGKRFIYKSSSSLMRLCMSIENILSDGLQKGGIFEKVSYWNFLNKIERCLPSTGDFLENIKTNKDVTSDLGRGRAFLFKALNSKTLPEYLDSLFLEDSLTKTYYSGESFICDEQNRSLMIFLLNGLSTVNFQLDTFEALLDEPNVWEEAQQQSSIENTSTPMNDESLQKKRKKRVTTVLVNIDSPEVKFNEKRATYNFSDKKNHSKKHNKKETSLVKENKTNKQSENIPIEESKKEEEETKNTEPSTNVSDNTELIEENSSSLDFSQNEMSSILGSMKEIEEMIQERIEKEENTKEIEKEQKIEETQEKEENPSLNTNRMRKESCFEWVNGKLVKMDKVEDKDIKESLDFLSDENNLLIYGTESPLTVEKNKSLTLSGTNFTKNDTEENSNYHKTYSFNLPKKETRNSSNLPRSSIFKDTLLIEDYNGKREKSFSIPEKKSTSEILKDSLYSSDIHVFFFDSNPKTVKNEKCPTCSTALSHSLFGNSKFCNFFYFYFLYFNLFFIFFYFLFYLFFKKKKF